MVKMICFDLDGTLADTYNVPNWLAMLDNSDPTPYIEAKPIYNPAELRALIQEAMDKGIDIEIITWLSKGSTNGFKAKSRKAKRQWLEKYNIPFHHFHGISYGTTKADCVRDRLKNGESAILVDDNKKIREGWHLGKTIDPTEGNMIEILRKLLD